MMSWLLNLGRRMVLTLVFQLVLLKQRELA